MITGTQITVYDWFAIQEELSNIMGIPDDKFREYHKIVGGEYKDFWHVCLDSIIPDAMHNDSIVTMYYYDDETRFEGEDEWKNKVLQAWNKFYKSIDDSKYAGIYVQFSW
jgi:hypothetical protein